MPEDHFPLPLSFEDLLGSAPDAVVVHDMVSRVLYWNQAAVKLYGWTAEEIAGHPVARIFYLNAAEREAAVDLLKGTGAWCGELRQLDRKGNEHLILARQQLIRNEAGEPSVVVSYNTDITERKKKEDAEERAHHIRSSNLLATGLAHELNNALAPIMLSSAMLKRSLEEPKARGMVSMIEKCANKGAQLVSELLDFERGRGGTSKEVIRRTQVERALKKGIESLCSAAVQVEMDIVEDLWECHGEMAELAEVFKHIIQNACEAMPEGGTLKIQVGNRLFDENFENLAPEAKAGAYITIVFTDTGHGIEDSLISHVAEPFFTTKEPKHGYGFGLANSQAIIKGHKGFMVLESEQGRGTSLSIFLPADMSSAKLEGSSPPFIFSKEGNGKLVLVADDEFFIRETIKKTLESRGYDVLTAQDGTEALAIYACRMDTIQLVVSNVAMPFMEGPARCRALKKMNPEVNILVSSGHTQPDKIRDLKATGVKHFLAKPYTADNLAEMVSSILGGASE